MQRMKRKEKIALLHIVLNKFKNGIDVDTYMLFKQRLDQVTYFIENHLLHTFLTLFLFFFFFHLEE